MVFLWDSTARLSYTAGAPEMKAGHVPARRLRAMREAHRGHRTPLFSERGCSWNVSTKSLQSCPTLCDPIDGSPPGSPVPGILQAKTLEWVAISSSRGSSHPGINLRLLHWQEDSLPSESPGKPEMGITVLIFHNRTLRLGECNLLKNHRALNVEAAVQAPCLQVHCFFHYTMLPSRRLPKELRFSPTGRKGSNDLGSAERKE